MSKYAYIFVERNMGQDYAFAYPPLGPITGWLWQHGVRDAAKLALDRREAELRAAWPEDKFGAALAEGISTYTYDRSWGVKHTIYSVKIAPDTLCPDPRAEGRCPYFVMHLLFPGVPEIISKRFGEFRDRCQEIAWRTMRSGEQSELKVEIPEDFYL